MNGKEKRILVLILICCILFCGLLIFNYNASKRMTVDLTPMTISHILSQTDTFVNNWVPKDYGSLTPQTIKIYPNSITITYDNDSPIKYIILRVIINKETNGAQIKYISHNPKQNFNNIQLVKYDLDYFIPKIDKLGFPTDFLYISKQGISFYYKNGMLAGACDTQTGEIKMFNMD